MPRTDFKTMYAMYGNDESTHRKKCRDKKRKKKDRKYDDILEIIKHLAKKKNLNDNANIEKATFKWNKPTGSAPTGDRPPIPPPPGAFHKACESLQREAENVDYKADWATRNSDFRNGELSIKSWVEFAKGKVDPLAVMEKLVRSGQVGGLGDRVEQPLYPDATGEDAYAIFEIRDFSSGNFGNLGDFLKKIEVQVKKWHHDPPHYSDLKSKRQVGGLCKKPDNDVQCKGNQVEDKGKCEDCPKGMYTLTSDVLGSILGSD